MTTEAAILEQLGRDVLAAARRADERLAELREVERLRPLRPAILAEMVAHPEVPDLGVALRVIRETRQISVQQVAERVGRDPRTVRHWERDLSGVAVDRVIAWAHAVDTSLGAVGLLLADRPRTVASA